MTYQPFQLWRFGPVVVRAPQRRRIVVAAAVFGLLGLSLLPAISAGEYGVPVARLGAVFKDAGTSFEAWVLWVSRLPRALVAIGAGAALGASGAVFQGITRNPLGSPDIIGINAGAAAGAVAVTLVWPGVMPVTAGALVGAITVVLGIFFAAGMRFRLTPDVIIAGIALNAMAIAFVQFGLTDVRTEQAQDVAAWLSGSVAARDWGDVALIFAFTLPAVTALVALSRRLTLFDLGDDLPIVMGVPVAQTLWLAVLLATGLAVGAVLVCGPVAFVALAAPHLARRLAKTNAVPIVLAALMGALLLSAANAVTLSMSGDLRLPVGVLTSGFGGVYLTYLLLCETRRP